jgi:hypothetical protein
MHAHALLGGNLRLPLLFEFSLGANILVATIHWHGRGTFSVM